MIGRVLLVALGFMLFACGEGDTENPSGAAGADGQDAEAQGLAYCCELGAICHVTGGSEDADIEECHLLGHRNDPVVCTEEYERCRTLCAGANDEPVEHACTP